MEREPEEIRFREGFAERLKYAMQKRGQTYEAVAFEAEISATTMYNYTQAKTTADIYKVLKIAKVLNVPMDYLCGRKKKEPECVLTKRMGGYMCSECRQVTGVGAGSDYKFCPYCGRKVVYRG